MIITSENQEPAKPNKLNSTLLKQIKTVVKSNKASEIETVTSKAAVPEEIEIKDTVEIKIPEEKKVNTEKKSEPAKPAKKEEPAGKKRNYSDTVILNLPGGERAEFKAFCAKYQVTMTDFIYFAMDYIRNGVEEKKYSLSRSGIREISNE